MWSKRVTSPKKNSNHSDLITPQHFFSFAVIHRLTPNNSYCKSKLILLKGCSHHGWITKLIYFAQAFIGAQGSQGCGNTSYNTTSLYDSVQKQKYCSECSHWKMGWNTCPHRERGGGIMLKSGDKDAHFQTGRRLGLSLM